MWRKKAVGSTSGKGYFLQIVCYTPNPHQSQQHPDCTLKKMDSPLNFHRKASLSRMGEWHNPSVFKPIPIPNFCCSSSCFSSFPAHGVEDADQGLGMVEGKGHREVCFACECHLLTERTPKVSPEPLEQNSQEKLPLLAGAAPAHGRGVGPDEL